MATINLGSIKFNWKGAFNNSTAYAVDDVVSSGGNSYVCIQASTGNAVGNATAYWNIMSAAGSNGTDGTDLSSLLSTRGDLVFKNASALARLAKGTEGQVLGQGANDPAWVNGSAKTLTTQGDILYRDGSGLQRLAKGTANKVLAMNSAANAPEWQTVAAGGKIVSVHYAQFTSTMTNGASAYSWQDITSLTKTISPASSSSKFWINYRASMGSASNHVYTQIVCDGTAVHIANAAGSRTRATSIGSPKATWDLEVHSGSYLWSPSTASNVTIKIQFTGEDSNGNQYVNQSHRDDNAASDGRATSDMTIFEINS